MDTNNPYVGPRAFRSNETLYGRDRELRILVDRLLSERIVLLHSPSGAGKTSLLQAGLIPELINEGFFVHPVIRLNAERPPELSGESQRPSDPRRFNRFVFSTLLSLDERYAPGSRTKLNRLARLSLADYLTLRAIEDEREGPEFLIFDQFEEILSIEPEDRQAKNVFFTQLRNILKNRNRWVLFVIRTDYVGALEPYARKIPTYLSNTFHLDFLGVQAALKAIQEPARKAGVRFSDSAANKLIDDLRRIRVQSLDGTVETQLGLYVEPVQLQVVCYRLWENKGEGRDVIDEEDLARLGDVNQSLAGYYAASVAQAAEISGEPERNIRNWFDHELITPEGTRSLVRQSADSSAGIRHEAIAYLEDTHLIRSEKRAGQSWYELAHDRLIDPIRDDNKQWSDLNLSLFQHQAHLWGEQGRSDGLLLRGRELEDAERQSAGAELTEEESDFLKACLIQRKRELRDLFQRRLIAVALAIVMLLFFVAVSFSITAQNNANAAEAAKSRAQATGIWALGQYATAQQAKFEAQSTGVWALDQYATAEYAKADAQAASTQAVSNANAADRALQIAETEKARANQQEQLAQEQKSIARANELVTLSLLAQNRSQSNVGALLSIEAFKIIDSPRTRIQLLATINPSNGIFLGTSYNAGISSYASFLPGDAGFVSSNFYRCDNNQPYLCRQGIFRTWSLSETAFGVRMALEYTFDRSGHMLDAVALTPDGKTIASIFCLPQQDNIVRCEKSVLILWDSETHQQIGDERVIATNIYNTRDVQMVYSPDGQKLAVSFNNERILLLDARDYQELASFSASRGIAQMVFSPDSEKLFYVSGVDAKLDVFDIKTLSAGNSLTIPSNTRSLISIAHQPGGSLLALGGSDGLILLWDWETSALLAQMYERESRILSLAFSPDGKILAAGHNNYALTLWDVASRQSMTRAIFRHSGAVTRLAFSNDGKQLLSFGEEIILWDVSPDSWLRKACSQAGRNFSIAEWLQYFPGEPYRVTCEEWPAGR